MGWGHCIAPDGREVGYMVEAECDHPDCHEKIDRGIGYVCGGKMHGTDETSCSGYYCSKHIMDHKHYDYDCECDYGFEDEEE